MRSSILLLIAAMGFSGCLTRSPRQTSTTSARSRARLVEPQPEFAWDMAICDNTQWNGHCDLEAGSPNEVDFSDNAFYVTVRSIGRGDVDVVVRLHKQKSNVMDGQALGVPGRRVRVSPKYRLDASNFLVTHKFEVADGVVQNGAAYMVVATSAGDELYASFTVKGARELDAPEGGGYGADSPSNGAELPVDIPSDEDMPADP